MVTTLSRYFEKNIEIKFINEYTVDSFVTRKEYVIKIALSNAHSSMRNRINKYNLINMLVETYEQLNY